MLSKQLAAPRLQKQRGAKTAVAVDHPDLALGEHHSIVR
jgi:hypothetical protein